MAGAPKKMLQYDFFNVYYLSHLFVKTLFNYNQI